MKKYTKIYIFFISLLFLNLQTIYSQKRKNLKSSTKYKRNQQRKYEVNKLGKCKTQDRYIQPNCKCKDGFYDDGIHDECQVCPYPCLTCENEVNFCQTCQEKGYISLQHFISQESIQNLENYIINEFKLFDDKNRVINKANKFRPNHGSAVYLHQDTPQKANFDFYQKRKWRGSSYYYPRSKNPELKKLYEFVDKIDFFEFTGFHFMIYNEPGDSGNLHYDHQFEDIIGEFMWVSPNNGKQFYILPDGEQDIHENRQFVTSNIIWFDDQLRHSIASSNKRQITFRIDGKFKPWIRQYIIDNYNFKNETRKKVFINQQKDIQPCSSNQTCEFY